ncbi:MAG: pyridoxal phosphate-dependent aminotransferase [Pyramidobacter sp.]|uniref:pyridoxal phosphate-dependent aminotransferase n=1 Tax=Pyramidobacter sp. TaxID=1943581 RepID=UPI002A80DAB2|nr:pyridoxal phosphate-dependent aminotransferase [Pyramidobacter sp.]MDY4032073.1 pyridoxal phosphate-dependent aminotransferase [Pyramidobacter sp.]
MKLLVKLNNSEINFGNDAVNFDVLKQRAYNLRWAEMPGGVIPLTAADSDFPCAPEIVDAIVRYSKKGYFSYTPKLGFSEFRESISKAFKIRKNEDIPPDLILPIDSAARAMSVIAKAFVKPGDEAIVCDPVDFLFKTSMEAAGAKIIFFPMKIVNGRIDFNDLEKYITPRTKMFGLCNPHNPLGLCYSIEDLDHLLRLSEKYGFYIMNDEIWSDMIYPDAAFTSIYTLGNRRNDRTLSVFGFSKSFGIAGLRAGCAYCTDPANFQKIVDASEVMTTIGGISSLSQVAGMACMDSGYYWVDAFRAHITKNRDYALERLSKMPFVKCYKPEATFVLFVDVSAAGMEAEKLANYLREEYKVAVVPGGKKFFGPGSEGYMRICLATSHEILEEGLNRIEKGLCALKR